MQIIDKYCSSRCTEEILLHDIELHCNLLVSLFDSYNEI